MKTITLVAAFLAGPIFTPSAGAQGGDPSPEASAVQKQLIGNWLAGGHPDQPAYIASSGAKLFAIDERRAAHELFVGDNGALLAKRGDQETPGLFRADSILWANGSWWSREPLPPPPDDVVIWNDPGSGWIPLKQAGTPAMENNAQPAWEWGGPEAPRMGGKTYRRDQFLFAHAPSHLRFTFEKPITEFRSVVGLIEGGRMGSVVFKIKTDGGTVFTSKLISHAWNHTEKVVLEFAPTKTLELITEPGENVYEDWSNWLAPEVK